MKKSVIIKDKIIKSESIYNVNVNVNVNVKYFVGIVVWNGVNDIVDSE